MRIRLILDMSGVFADVTGPGSAAAATMAVADFGDHQNKADVAAVAREWFDTGKVDAILDVAASAPALAVWHLTPLAEWLRANGGSRFLLTAPPLRLPGAVGSPTTPIATV